MEATIRSASAILQPSHPTSFGIIIISHTIQHKCWHSVGCWQCCGSGRFFPDLGFSIPDPLNIEFTKNLSILNQRMVAKLWEICRNFFWFIPDPGSGSFLFFYPGSIGQK